MDSVFSCPSSERRDSVITTKHFLPKAIQIFSVLFKFFYCTDIISIYIQTLYGNVKKKKTTLEDMKIYLAWMSTLLLP